MLQDGRGSGLYVYDPEASALNVLPRHLQMKKSNFSELHGSYLYAILLYRKEAAIMSDKLKAQAAVTNAVRAGRLPHPSTLQCSATIQYTNVYRDYPYFESGWKQCENTAHVYHHTHGYEPAHWLTVKPLCAPCHGRTHNPPTTPQGKHRLDQLRTNRHRAAQDQN